MDNPCSLSGCSAAKCNRNSSMSVPGAADIFFFILLLVIAEGMILGPSFELILLSAETDDLTIDRLRFSDTLISFGLYGFLFSYIFLTLTLI